MSDPRGKEIQRAKTFRPDNSCSYFFMKGSFNMAKAEVIFEKCKGCALCTNACPKNLMKIQKDKRNKKGLFTAECTDQTQCIGCAMCAIMCPDCAIIVSK